MNHITKSSIHVQASLRFNLERSDVAPIQLDLRHVAQKNIAVDLLEIHIMYDCLPEKSTEL
jgi:hypothetical protein